MSERHYLELSQEEGVSHKFYEVIIDGADVTIRYGRIGTNGTKKTQNKGTPDKARAFAMKKIGEKKRKGYEEAVMGVRKKRPITRRTMTSTRSQSKVTSPILWKFETGRAAFGVFVDDERCWVGNESGRVFALNHEGEVQRQYKLPDGVKCIVDDGEWLYAGCDDGKVYDLNTKIPLVAYEIAANVDIFWLDIRDGILGVSDRQGNVMTVNHEEESQWTRKSNGSSGWMVRCDEIGVYHGHSGGITMYDWEDGEVIWENTKPRNILFGWQEETTVYGGCSDGKIYQVTKRGEMGRTYHVGAPVFSCAASEDGKWVFGGDNRSTIYCFDEGGKQAWAMSTGCGSAFSMQYHKDRLYIVTTNGTLACIDVSEEAIERAKSGGKTKSRSINAPAASADVAVGASLPETSEAGDGVVIHCLMVGSKLRARVLSDGYNKEWNVQFPRELRKDGARFVVGGVKEADRGGFYRIFGEIQRLV